MANKESSMRPTARNLSRFPTLLLTVALAALACQNSSSVTGPSNDVAAPAGNVTGSWSGTFQSDDIQNCGGSTATATFQQVGSTVTGNVVTSTCGVGGLFQGTLQGNTLMGKIAMEGCVGGGASGTINGSEISLSISDLTKPLVTFDKPVLMGGVVTLRR
jgi:hypothetical protein